MKTRIILLYSAKHCKRTGSGIRKLGAFNPFTVVLAVPPLGKRSIGVPDLKSLRLFPFRIST